MTVRTTPQWALKKEDVEQCYRVNKMDMRRVSLPIVNLNFLIKSTSKMVKDKTHNRCFKLVNF